DDRIVRHVARDHTTRAHYSILTNRHATQNRRAGANGCPALDACPHHLPVLIALKLATGSRGSRIFVINERDVVADESLILNGDTFADKRVAGYFHVLAYVGVFLDLNKRADLGVITDRATIQVDKGVDADVLA